VTQQDTDDTEKPPPCPWLKRLLAVVLLAVPLAFGIASAQTAKGKTDEWPGLPETLLNVAENLHRQSAGRVVCFRHFLGPFPDLDVQCWRVVARHDASRSVTVAADPSAVQCHPFDRIATFHAS
jgi:hypothetical protein